ncbi:MAG: MFS transporter, partial [Gammaproteobacteria bacterium]
LGELGFALGLGFLNGGLVATFAELIPNAVRCTGIGVGYNTAMAAFGGTTPMIAAWLVTATGNPIAPAYWVAAACGVSLLTTVFLVPETRYKPLGQ